MSYFLSFRTMITPGIMKVLCYLGMIICVVVGGAMAAGGVDDIGGIGIVILGPIVVRIYSELMIVIFEIHGELKKMNDSGGSH